MGIEHPATAYPFAATEIYAFPAIPRPDPAARHRLLLECYLSGQMSGADVECEIRLDPGFGAFLARHDRRAA
jgi:hypothetical protein